MCKPLLEASSKGKTSEVQRILASSGNIVNCVDDHNGKTVLMYVVHGGHADTTHEQGASLEAFDIGRGYTVLMWASVRGHADAARMLVLRGASLGRSTRITIGQPSDSLDVGEPFRAVLMWAIHFGHADTVRVLVEHGASLEAVDNWGSNALEARGNER